MLNIFHKINNRNRKKRIRKLLKKLKQELQPKTNKMVGTHVIDGRLKGGKENL